MLFTRRKSYQLFLALNSCFLVKDMAANGDFVSLGANEVNADYLNYIDLDCDALWASLGFSNGVMAVDGVNVINKTELPSVDLPSEAPVNCAGKGKNLEQQQESSAKSKSTRGRKKGSRNKKSSDTNCQGNRQRRQRVCAKKASEALVTECATETLSATDQTDNSRSNVKESSSCLDNTAVPMIEIVNSNNTAAEQDTDVVSTVCGLQLDNTMPKTKTKTTLTYLERLLRRSKMHKHEMVQLVCKILHAFSTSTRSGDDGIWTEVIGLFQCCNFALPKVKEQHKAVEEIEEYLKTSVFRCNSSICKQPQLK